MNHMITSSCEKEKMLHNIVAVMQLHLESDVEHLFLGIFINVSVANFIFCFMVSKVGNTAILQFFLRPIK